MGIAELFIVGYFSFMELDVIYFDNFRGVFLSMGNVILLPILLGEVKGKVGLDLFDFGLFKKA